MAYQSEVSRMLLTVKKPSPGSSGGSRSSSSLLFSRVAAGSISSSSSSSSDSKSVLSSSSSLLLRASNKLRAAAAAAGKGFLASSSSSGAAAAALAAGGSGVLGHAAAAATATSAAAAAQQQQHIVVHFRGQQTSVGFLLSKVVELLKHHAGRALHVKEVEKALIHNGFTSLHLFFQSNSEFLKLLSSNERVAYNPVNRSLAFHNPYEAITSCSALLARICYEGLLTGLRVEQELLSAHAEMEGWIHSLLAARRVRAVRGNNNHLRGKKKCLALGSHPGGPAAAAACDIYATRKCVNCRQNLVGLLLYPLADEIYENARMHLDAEVKGLWDSVELPPLEDIVKECHPRRGLLPPLGSGMQQSDRRQCKRQAECKRASRYRSKFRRIQNTHLFTAEELRSISEQQ